jgi:tripartite-type tricarboxylate transporter receptor subunit TctC
MRFHAHTSPTNSRINEQTILNPNLKPTILALAALCATTTAFAADKLAKDYPNKPIRVIVPSPAGGPPDLVMRMLLPYYSQSLGQPLVIDNRTGAGGVVGSATVAKGTPDGYTWLLTTASHTNTPPFSKNVPFDPVKDFSHVTLVAQNFGQALVVPVNSPAKSVADLIAAAKKAPGKMNYASAGIGTASHIPAEVMKSMAGVDIVGVQYKGVPEGVTDTIAGRMDLMFVGTQIALPLLQSGRLRVLALTGAKRWKGMPDVPTMQESGFKGYDLINWFGLWLPPGASPALLARLHAETVKALAAPEVLKQFDVQGLEGVGLPPAEFLKFVTAQSAFMNELARKIDAGAK